MRQPCVALIATGRELVTDPEQPLLPGQIRDGTSYYLLSQLRAAGARVVWQAQVGDDAVAFDAALAQARQAGADVILSTGAVSRGRYDFVPDALTRHNAQRLFHKVAVRPGKPVLLAGLPDGVLYVGLPGNPMASAAGLRFFVEPALRGLLGMPHEHGLPVSLARTAAGAAGMAPASACTADLFGHGHAQRAGVAAAGILSRGAVAASQCLGSGGAAAGRRCTQHGGAGVRPGPSATGCAGIGAMKVFAQSAQWPATGTPA